MNNQELALINQNEKIAIKTALVEMNLGTAGHAIKAFIEMEGSTHSVVITIQSIRHKVESQIIRDKLDYKKSSGPGDPATYPRKWLKNLIREFIELKLKKLFSDFIYVLER